MLGHRLGQALGGVVEDGEAVAAGGQEAAGFGHGVGSVRAPGRGLDIAVGQGELLLLIGGVEPQQGLGDAGKVGGDVGGLQRRQVDVGEHRILQHRLQARRLIRAAIAGQGGDVHLVGLGQAQQHLGAQRAVVALQQGDVGGRDLQIGGHIGLGQAMVAAQPPQAWGRHRGAVQRAWSGQTFFLWRGLAPPPSRDARGHRAPPPPHRGGGGDFYTAFSSHAQRGRWRSPKASDGGGARPPRNPLQHYKIFL